MSVSGRSTSSNTRCSGSANDVAVYCIRAVRSVCAARPQRQRRRLPGGATATANAPARRRPDADDQRERRSARRDRPAAAGQPQYGPRIGARHLARRAAQSSTRRNAGATTRGATASTRQASAADPSRPACWPGLPARGGRIERGRARNPTPNALTIAVTPSPVVRATAPTASGVANATTCRGRTRRGSATAPAATR